MYRVGGINVIVYHVGGIDLARMFWDTPSPKFVADDDNKLQQLFVNRRYYFRAFF